MVNTLQQGTFQKGEDRKENSMPIAEAIALFLGYVSGVFAKSTYSNYRADLEVTFLPFCRRQGLTKLEDLARPGVMSSFAARRVTITDKFRAVHVVSCHRAGRRNRGTLPRKPGRTSPRRRSPKATT